MAFYPYLNFGNCCREAFTRYHEIFGGELELLEMSDMPGEVAPEQADLIMHAALKTGDSLLMASDTGDPNAGPVTWSYVNYSTPDLDDARRVWDALSKDGKVEMPFGEQFWSPGFGVCTDRFGVQWMVSAEPAEGQGTA